MTPQSIKKCWYQPSDVQVLRGNKWYWILSAQNSWIKMPRPSLWALCLGEFLKNRFSGSKPWNTLLITASYLEDCINTKEGLNPTTTKISIAEILSVWAQKISWAIFNITSKNPLPTIKFSQNLHFRSNQPTQILSSVFSLNFLISQTPIQSRWAKKSWWLWLMSSKTNLASWER